MDGIKLHLGCGRRFLEGYVHVDLAEFAHIDYRHNINALPMFQDDTVALIYACHVLEYFDRIEVLEVLREWKRILAPGGRLRLAVPDFQALAELYGQTGNLDFVLGPLFGRWQTPDGGPIYHKTVYDYKSLAAILKQSGFTRVRYWDWRDVFSGQYEGYDDFSQAYIPHMDKEKGKHISLNIEADKPMALD